MQVQDINILCSPGWPTLHISTLHAVLDGQHYMQVQDINNSCSPGWPTLYASSRYQRFMQSWVANVACKFKISMFQAALGGGEKSMFSKCKYDGLIDQKKRAAMAQ